MPFSSPSYFPNARNPDQVIGVTAGIGATGVRQFLAMLGAGKNCAANDVVAIGENAAGGSSSGMDNTSTSMVAIGDGSFANIVTKGPTSTIGNVGIGLNVGNQWTAIAGVVALGEGTAQNCAGGSGLAGSDFSVLIGAQVAQNAVTGVLAPQFRNLNDNVFIGRQVFQCGVTNSGRANQSVIIGSLAAQNSGSPAGTFVTNSVIVGAQAAETAGGGSSMNVCTLLGFNTAAAIVGGNAATIVGAQVGTDSVCLNGVAVGQGSSLVIQNNCTVIGQGCTLNGQFTSPQNSVLIGSGPAGANYGNSFPTFTFVLETANPGTPNTYFPLCMGNFATGCMILGAAQVGTSRDVIAALAVFGGTNCIKLMNGTAGTGGNPVSGGYFYVSSGTLHWVGSSGTDTTIAVA